MKTLIIAVLLAGSFFASAGEIADYHRKNGRNKSGDYRKSRSHNEVGSTNHGITEIGIERSGCFGSCPIYTFIVKSDGTVRYKGMRFVEREGEFTGSISVGYFHRLAQFIRDSGYMELEDGYRRGITDHATIYTMVVMTGQRKTISNYANAGPTKLWAIEQLIDDLMAKVKWDASAEIRQSLAADALLLASAPGKWESEVVKLTLRDGKVYDRILGIEFGPASRVGQTNAQLAQAKLYDSSLPKGIKGVAEVSTSLGDGNFQDVRLRETNGVRTITITRAVDAKDPYPAKTQRLFDRYQSVSFRYELTNKVLTLKGFPTSNKVNWGISEFIVSQPEIAFKRVP